MNTEPLSDKPSSPATDPASENGESSQAKDPAASDEAAVTAEQTSFESEKEATSLSGDDELVTALLESRQANGELREQMLRMQAEMDNLRKRLMRDLERSRKRALEAVMSDLLPVRDSLDRGMEAATEEASVEALREGNALIIKMLGKVMSDHGLVELEPRGEAFNPELHEAISLLPSADHPADTVIEVVQKGYMLNDFLIRPARVVVSSGAKAS